MPVYFAYRSFDLGPTGKYLKRFENMTVLEWFQHYWDELAIEDDEHSDERLTELLGCDGWFLWNPFSTAVREGIARPADGHALLNLLRLCVGNENFRGSEHCLQVFTEEDGEGGALYYFDDHFLKSDGGRAAYLLYDDWRLPSGHREGEFVSSVETRKLKPGGSGAGATYVVLLERESKYPLDDLLSAYRVDGIRLPELAQHLCCYFPNTDDGFSPHSLHKLPALMLAGVELADPEEAAFLCAVQQNPDDAVTWAAWSDWCQDRDREPPGIRLLRGAFERIARLPGHHQDVLRQDADVAASCRELLALEEQNRSELRTALDSLIHVEGHLAQMCLDGSHTDVPYYGQWVIFDDLWACAHADLACAILRFAARWDVLSPD